MLQEACETSYGDVSNCVLPPTAPQSPPPSPPPPSPPPSPPPPSIQPPPPRPASAKKRNDTLLIGLVSAGAIVFGLAVAFALVACTGCLDGFMSTPDSDAQRQAFQSLALRAGIAQVLP
jgi:hypothetical protein